MIYQLPAADDVNPDKEAGQLAVPVTMAIMTTIYRNLSYLSRLADRRVYSYR